MVPYQNVMSEQLHRPLSDVYSQQQLQSGFKMQYLSNLQLVQSIARQIVQDRRCNYSEQSLHNFLNNHPHIQHTTLTICNRRKETLWGSLFKSPSSNSITKPCIIYLHALGSNRLESLHIINYVIQYYDVMSFDFSGSGKSQGEYTTFGLWEKEDINCVVEHLSIIQQYQNYVIWGRSMGAVSGALYLHKYPSNSAFSSFEKTALELACGKSSLPEFMLNACMIPLKKCFKEHYTFDPFEIDLSNKIKEVGCKIVLVYSQKDTVVNYTNSLIISQSCLRSPEIIKIQQDHNTYRKGETYDQIVKIIQETFICAEKKSRSRGIRLYSNSKDKKGIELSRCGSRLKTQQHSSKRLSLNGRRNSIFSSIQTQTEILEQPRRRKKICVLPMFYQSELLMLNSHKQKPKQRQRVDEEKQKEKENKQNSRFGDNLMSKMHINAIRKNRFGLK